MCVSTANPLWISLEGFWEESALNLILGDRAGPWPQLHRLVETRIHLLSAWPRRAGGKAVLLCEQRGSGTLSLQFSSYWLSWGC